MHFLPRRLNARIVFSISCVLLLTGIASGWMAASRQTSAQLAAMRANSAAMVRNFAEGAARALVVEDYAELETFLLKSVELPDIERLQVFEAGGALIWDVARGNDGNPKARTGVLRIQVPADRAMRMDIVDGHLVIWHPVEAGKLLGWMKAEIGLSGIRAAQAGAWENAIILAMAWVACSALLIYLILRPNVRAIRDLAEFSQGLDERKGRQISLGGQPTEIAELADSLNDASSRLLASEREVHDERERLRASEEKYRTIFEESFDGLFITTPAGKIVEMNKKGIAMFGYATKDEILKLDLARDVYAHPPDRARILAMVAERGTAEYEVEVKKRDGSTFIAHCALTAVRDESGNIATFRGIIRDVTAAKQAEAEILKLNRELERRVAERTAQLEAANKELEAFSYSVSHDLRAPLRHIDGFVHLLEEDVGASLNEEDRHYMDVISKAARQMETLIDDLLAFSRVGRSELRKTPVDLGALVAELVQEFEPETRGRTVEWNIATLPVVTGDRAMLRVVMSNLILNALKFTRPRDPAVIEIGCQHDAADEDIVFVRDNGAGFDMAYADKLFGAFQRLHRADEFEGTGIGLANVRRVIGRHGGRTWAEGEVGKGATFYFSLPRVAEDAAVKAGSALL